MAIETTSGARLFEAHVERFNAGVRSGDFGPMVAAFSDDAGSTSWACRPGRSRAARRSTRPIASMPPDDEIDVLSVDEPDDATVVAPVRVAGDRGHRAR